MKFIFKLIAWVFMQIVAFFLIMSNSQTKEEGLLFLITTPIGIAIGIYSYMMWVPKKKRKRYPRESPFL